MDVFTRNRKEVIDFILTLNGSNLRDRISKFVDRYKRKDLPDHIIRAMMVAQRRKNRNGTIHEQTLYQWHRLFHRTRNKRTRLKAQAEKLLSQGKSKVEVARELGVCRKTVYNWIEKIGHEN